MKQDKAGLGKLYEKRDVRLLFALCWTVYCVSYLGRLNYSSAMTVMIAEGVADSAQAGLIGMLYFLAYGIGQLINGFLGDRRSPARMIFTGLLASGIANVLMGLWHEVWAMALLWCANGYFQAMIWAPILRLFAEMLEEKSKVDCSVNIVSSMVFGTLFSYLLSAGVLALTSWPYVFEAAALFLLGTALVWKIGFREVQKRAAAPEKSVAQARQGRAGQSFAESEKKAAQVRQFGGRQDFAEPEKSVAQTRQCEAGQDFAEAEKEAAQGKQTVHWKQGQPQPAPSFRTQLLSSGMLSLLFPVLVHGMLKDGVTSWVPTYISESFGVAASFSVLLTALLPVVNLSGAYMARWVYRRSGEKIALSASFFFALATAALALLCAAGRVSPFLSAALLAVITASMLAVNTLVVNLYPLRFLRYGRVSGVSGFLNATAYIGTAVSAYGIGVLVQNSGWQTTIAVWLAVTAAAGVAALLASRGERGKKNAGEKSAGGLVS